MANGNVFNPSSVSVDGVSIDPAGEGSASVTRGETTGEVTIPAGQRYVRIRVAGFVQDNDTESDATINGSTWSVGSVEEFHAGYDRQNNEELLLPEFTINGNGGRVFYSYYS